MYPYPLFASVIVVNNSGLSNFPRITIVPGSMPPILLPSGNTTLPPDEEILALPINIVFELIYASLTHIL